MDPASTSNDAAGPSLRRRVFRVAVLTAQLAIVVALAVWASEAFDGRALLGHLRAIPTPFLLLALGLQLCAVALYAWRLAQLLDAPFWTGFWTLNVGIGLNTVLPFRAGDVARIVVGRSVFGVPVARFSAATVVEKLLDLAVALALVVLVIAHGASTLLPPERIAGYSALLAVALAAVGASVVLVPRGRGLLLRMRSAGRFLIDMIEQIRRYSVWRLVALTALIWVANVAVVRVMLDAAVAESRGAFGWFGCLAVQAVVALSLALPGAPAALGLFEAAVVIVLVNLYRVTPESALALALAYHFITVAPSLLALAIFTGARGYFARER